MSLQKQFHKSIEQENIFDEQAKLYFKKKIYVVHSYSLFFSYGAEISFFSDNKDFTPIILKEKNIDVLVDKIIEQIPVGEHIRLKNYGNKGYHLRKKKFSYIKEELEKKYIVSPITISI